MNYSTWPSKSVFVHLIYPGFVWSADETETWEW